MTIPTIEQRLAARERPAGAPVMRQRWAELLFLHWAWEPAEIQRRLPKGLFVDTHDGQAWLGLVPFRMQRVRPRFCPAVPGLSDFLELNVRTYVHDAEGRPGVWFFSLDANQWLAVQIARGLFHLPYEHAAMRATTDARTGALDFRAQRRGSDHESRFVYRTGVHADAAPAVPGTLPFFLVERYRLYAADQQRERLYAGMVHHTPYLLQAADDAAWDDGMMLLDGFDRGGRAPDHCCAAGVVDVEIWPLRRV